MEFLRLLFRLPDGSIYSNLVASAIGFVVGMLWAHRKIVVPMREHHAKLREIHERIVK